MLGDNSGDHVTGLLECPKGPTYLCDLPLYPKLSWALRSPGSIILIIPHLWTKTHDERSFYHYSPHWWDSLPDRLIYLI